jgi:phage gp45-like
MVVRSSTRDASTQSSLALSRATVRDLNTKPQWSEVTQLDVFPGETATDVEFAENYGSTMRPAKQDEEEDEQKQQGQGQQGDGSGPGGAGEEGEQPKGDSAEAIVGYMNGQRSHPVVLAMGDRRHRLLELEEGDVAQHRLKDDRQQVLLAKDGTFVSTRQDKKFRAALVPKESKEKQQQPGQQQQADAGGGGTSGSGSGKQQKQLGQKSAKKDNEKSEVAIEQNGTQTFSQHGQFYGAQRGGQDSSVYYKDRKQSAQATDAHVHMRFEKNRIWVDKDGHWSEEPILQKKDKHCKE